MQEHLPKNETLLKEKFSFHEDNLQATINVLSQTEWGWLAGIVDGEGSIIMAVRNKQVKSWKGKGIEVQINLGNTDGGIIHKYVGLLNRLGIQPKLREFNGSKNSFLKKCMIYTVVMKMSQILILLTGIEPHLASEKKYRAQLMIKFVQRRLTYIGARTKQGASWYTDEDWQIAADFLKVRPYKSVDEVLREHTIPSDKDMTCSDLTGDRKSSPEMAAASI